MGQFMKLDELAAFGNVTIAVSGKDLKESLERFAEIVMAEAREEERLAQSRKAYTVAEAAEVLRVSKRSIQKWIQYNNIESVKWGGRVLIRESEIERILNSKNKNK